MSKKIKFPIKSAGIPAEVDFGFIRARVYLRSSTQVPGHEVGHITYGAGEIHIQDGLHPDYEKEVMLHECLHGLINYNELLSENLKQFEEDIVKTFSPALLRLLRDNPALVEYLTGNSDAGS